MIHVNERMTYTDVKKILKKEDPEVTRRYQELVPMFFQMEELSALLRKRRKKRGAIDFDFPETKVELDEMENRSVSIPMNRMWRPGSLKISCWRPMKR